MRCRESRAAPISLARRGNAGGLLVVFWDPACALHAWPVVGCPASRVPPSVAAGALGGTTRHAGEMRGLAVRMLELLPRCCRGSRPGGARAAGTAYRPMLCPVPGSAQPTLHASVMRGNRSPSPRLCPRARTVVSPPGTSPSSQRGRLFLCPRSRGADLTAQVAGPPDKSWRWRPIRRAQKQSDVGECVAAGDPLSKPRLDRRGAKLVRVKHAREARRGARHAAPPRHAPLGLPASWRRPPARLIRPARLRLSYDGARLGDHDRGILGVLVDGEAWFDQEFLMGGRASASLASICYQEASSAISSALGASDADAS